MTRFPALSVVAIAVLLFTFNRELTAEPYLAVHTGQQCSVCHTNPTGGGKRTVFGNVYAQTQLSARYLTTSDTPEYWTGIINKFISVGGDLRSNLSSWRMC